MGSSSTAFKTFSLANNITDIGPSDEIYRFDSDLDKRIRRDQPWTKE